MRQSDWEEPGNADVVVGNLTRREALKRGTLAGLGLVWATPSVVSVRMTAQLAQATSPVPETTVPGEDTTVPGNTTTEPGDTTTEPTTANTVETIPRAETTPSSGPTEPTVKGITVETTETSQPAGTGAKKDEVKDEVLASELPFTGLPLEQLLPLAGGALATGAAAVRLARERKGKPAPTEEERAGDSQG